MLRLTALAAIAGLAFAVPARADAVTWAYPGCTVGTASAQCLASTASMQHYINFENKSSTANVACIWAAAGSTASLTDVLSFKLGPLSSLSYNNVNAMPAGPLVCISDTASTPLYVEGF